MSNFRLIIGLLLILVSFSSCRPRNVLSRGDMADVLYDLHLAEALADPGSKPLPVQWKGGMSDIDFRDMAFQSVLRKYDITEDQFYASVSYYSKKLRLYSKIYAEVDERLQDLLINANQFRYFVPSLKMYKAQMTIDTIKICKWFNLGKFNPDTIPSKVLVPASDSILSYGAWFASQYLPGHKSAVNKFTMIPKMTAVIAAKYAADSLGHKADSVIHQIDTAVNRPVFIRKDLPATGSRRVLPAGVRNTALNPAQQEAMRLKRAPSK